MWADRSSCSTEFPDLLSRLEEEAMATLKMITRHFIKDDTAATMVEYALMLVLIAVVCIGIVTSLGTSVSGAFTSTNAAF
jgi:pilus assembly protein Flp/PilA